MRLSYSLFILIFLLPLVGGCSGKHVPIDTERRADVETLLDRTGKFLKEENESKIRRFISQDYYGGYREVERRLERTWNEQQVLDFDFNINRILEKDGLYNVQVKWHKSYLNKKGLPQKKSGISEIILVPHRNSFRILNMSGDNFF